MYKKWVIMKFLKNNGFHTRRKKDSGETNSVDGWRSGRYEEDGDPELVDGRQGLIVVAKALQEAKAHSGL
jgi:hypothetical protein